MFAMGISLLITSSMLFYVGFHNADLAFNMLRVANANGLSYYDWVDVYNQAGDTISYDQSYIIGTDYMQYGFLGMLIAGLLIGSFITQVKIDKKKKK